MRINIGNRDGNPVYRVAQIVGVKGGFRKYMLGAKETDVRVELQASRPPCSRAPRHLPSSTHAHTQLTPWRRRYTPMGRRPYTVARSTPRHCPLTCRVAFSSKGVMMRRALARRHILAPPRHPQSVGGRRQKVL